MISFEEVLVDKVVLWAAAVQELQEEEDMIYHLETSEETGNLDGEELQGMTEVLLMKIVEVNMQTDSEMVIVVALKEDSEEEYVTYIVGED